MEQNVPKQYTGLTGLTGFSGDGEIRCVINHAWLDSMVTIAYLLDLTVWLLKTICTVCVLRLHSTSLLQLVLKQSGE